LPKVILVVYIHVHYSIYIIISLYLKAISCTPMRTCASMYDFPKSPQAYVVILRQQKIGRKQSSHNPSHLITYLVAHATRKPPGPANLLERGIIRQNSSITQVMQEEANQVIPLLTTRHNLCTNISRIVNIRHMPND
jgi:hypothetical protein